MIGISIDLFNIFESVVNNDSYLLVIENKKKLYNFLKDLSSGSIINEFITVFDENNKKQKVSDYIDAVTSLLYFDINNKKNLNALIRLIKKTMMDSLIEHKQNLNDFLHKVFSDIKLELPVEIYCDQEATEDDLIKLLNINILDEDLPLLERIEHYIKVSYEIRNIRIFLFYDLFSFLEEKEIQLLIDSCKYNDIKIMVIENKDIKSNIFDRKIIIDEDICLLNK